MSRYSRKPATGSAKPRRDPLASLRMADMVISKPFLPAEIISTIVDHLAVPDLLRFARVSRRIQEMVYDDARWIQFLKRMECWNEDEARLQNTTQQRRSTIDRSVVNGKGRPEKLISPIKAGSENPPWKRSSDGFDTIAFSNSVSQNEIEIALTIFDHVRCVRGYARREYGKIHRVLAPYYYDALVNSTPSTSRIFRTFTLPEQQALMLAQVNRFSKSDISSGKWVRHQSLNELANIFDTSALLEFRKGYEYRDIQGRMRQYARVMHTLNGGRSSIDLFLTDNRLIAQKGTLGTVGDCVDYSSGRGELSLERVNAYFERLGNAYQQEAAVVQNVFPDPVEVSILLLEKVGQEILSPFMSDLFTDARTRSTSVYLRVIAGSLAATKRFAQDFALPKDANEEMVQRASDVLVKIFEPHLESYLDEELSFFRQKADSEVQNWDRALSEQIISTETFLMSNVNCQADKKDFMSSFKKVVMMPVNILPSFSHKSKPSNEENSLQPPRSETPTQFPFNRSSTPLPAEAPSTELAAKAAVMTSRLENIKSLFSIEIALNLVHAAKSSLERAAQFVTLGGEAGEKSRIQCNTIFVTLLDAVGDKHVRVGFDKAIEHLGAYNPRGSPNLNKSNVVVAPLTTFLELVNVGDLIQQMLDVFYENELVAYGISRRDDFLDPPVKEKKKFEAMLDERVAKGLAKGIDVLMDEVEFICATEQLLTDFNPSIQVFDASSSGHENSFHQNNSSVQNVDVSPTPTCEHIIELIQTHVNMLNGSTEKSLLDVFTSELSLRLFQTLTKHIKRQRVSPLGAIRLLSDLTAYSRFVAPFRNQELNLYFNSLREVGQIYLFEGKTNTEIDEMSGIIADAERYRGVFTVEEVVEFAERRSDWLLIKSKVEGKVKGESCVVM